MTRKIMQFGAPWCAPCKTVRPFVENLAKDMGVAFEYVDVDKDLGVANEWSVRGVPTILFIKDGTEMGRVNTSGQHEIRTVARGALG